MPILVGRSLTLPPCLCTSRDCDFIGSVVWGALPPCLLLTLLSFVAEVMGATPVAWTRATVTVPSFKTEKEECDHNFSKMEQLIQCSFEHCVQTGMFKYG